MDIMARITGAAEIEKALGNLTRVMTNRALRPALREGAKIVKDKAGSNVEKLANKGYATGLLAKSYVVRSLKMKNKMLRMAVAIKPNIKSLKDVRVGLYGSVFELGKEGQAPQPALRVAQAETKSQVKSTVIAESAKRLKAAVAEARK
jgi:HK97 gp10 family phage protein